jgi:ligand-binding sensor domain-containing protein
LPPPNSPRLSVAALVLLGLAIGIRPAGAALPADWRLQRWTSEDGLAHNSVYALVQDRQGFLWIGTVDGLDRFDGYEFVHYRHDPTEPGSLANQVVRSLLEDREGRLWIGTGDGISRMDRARERFASYSLGHGENAAKLVWCLFEDRAGRLWAGADRGLFRYDPTGDRFVAQPLSTQSAEATTVDASTRTRRAAVALVATSEG